MINIFSKRKKDVLSKSDKSSIGKWDEKISELCDKINSLENYYTTSSCSGRIILMVDAEKKGKDLFVAVYHDKISFDELKKGLDNAIKKMGTSSGFFNSRPRLHITALNFAKSLTTPATQQEVAKKIKFKLKQDQRPSINSNLKIKFKLEPCILHVACKTLEDAESLYNKAKLAGWKKSGIVGVKNGFTAELNSTEKLEFPIIQNKKILVDDEFLKIITEEANKKLEKSWMKIEKLKGMIK